MKIVAALLIILFLAFSGYHLSFRSFRLPVFARTFHLTGTEYLFLGLLLGPLFFNILDPATLSGLEPLTALLLGWVGLLCGFQVEIKILRSFSKQFFLSALSEAVITFSIVFAAVFFLIPFCFQLPETTRFIVSITLAASAACSAQTGLALLTATTIRKRSELIMFLKYISSVDSLIALFLFHTVFFLNYIQMKPSVFFSTSGPSLLVVASTIFFLILLYNIFLAQKRTRNELLLVIVGMVVLTSGAASALHFSPLLANFFIGMFIVNTTREKERIFSLLISIEKPLYLLLLVFIGSYWVPDALIFILIAIVYSLLRLTGKFSGGFVATKMNYKMEDSSINIGFGLIEQGGVPLAILFDFQQMFGDMVTSQIVSIAIISLIINDLISPVFIQRLLGRKSI